MTQDFKNAALHEAVITFFKTTKDPFYFKEEGEYDGYIKAGRGLSIYSPLVESIYFHRKNGADINSIYKNKTLADLIFLMDRSKISAYGLDEYIELLINFGFNTNTKNVRGNNTINSFIIEHYYPYRLHTKLKLILSKGGSDPNEFNNYLDNSFTYLMEQHDLDTLRKILKYSRYGIDHRMIKEKTGKLLPMFFIDTIQQQIDDTNVFKRHFVIKRIKKDLINIFGWHGEEEINECIKYMKVHVKNESILKAFV